MAEHVITVEAADTLAATYAATARAREAGGKLVRLRPGEATSVPPSAGQQPLRTFTATIEVPDDATD